MELCAGGEISIASGHGSKPFIPIAACTSQQLLMAEYGEIFAMMISPRVPLFAGATPMSQAVNIQLELPDDLLSFRLPVGVQQRLQHLLDKQDAGQPLSSNEQREAEGLVNLAEVLTMLRLRAERLSQ
jgi:hypothetical protein